MRSGELVLEQSDFAQLNQLLCINPSGALADTTSLTGSPPKPSASGFGGERRRKEVNGAFRPKGGNGVHGLCDDAGAVSGLSR